MRLHLHRGYGWGLYGTLTAVVGVVALLATARYVSAGEFIFAGVMALGGVVVAGFLGIVTYAIVWPELTASTHGVQGRMCWGRTFDGSWSEITIDVDEGAEAHTLRLELGQQSVSINAQTWMGFNDFVVLVASSAHASARLTPEARAEVLRMFGLPG